MVPPCLAPLDELEPLLAPPDGLVSLLPHARVEVLAPDDPAAAARERDEQSELADGEVEGSAAREHQAVDGPDLERADVEDVVQRTLGRFHDALRISARAPALVTRR